MRFSYGFNLLRILANQVHIDQFAIYLILTNASQGTDPAKALYVVQELSAYEVAVFLCCLAIALFYINENIAVSV